MVITYCTDCGNQIEDEKYCPNCGKRVVASDSYASDNENRPYAMNAGHMQTSLKNPGVAALLAALFGFFGLGGIGHIYVEKIGKGVAILILLLFITILMYMDLFAGGGILILLLSIPAFILWIWQIFDAHSLAKQYNDSVHRTGLPPKIW